MRRAFLAWGVLGAVLLLALWPSLALAGRALAEPAGFVEALTSARGRELLLRSVGLAAGATGVALALGLVTGRVAARLEGGRAAWFEAGLVLPLCVPPQVAALGWLALVGREGALTRLLPAALRPDPFTPTAAALLLGASLFPLVALATAHGTRAFGRGPAAAARAVASPARVFWRLELRYLVPWLASACAVTFLLAFMDFGVPSALMVNAYPIEVLSRLGALQDVPRALGSAAAGLLLVVGVGVARVLFVRADPWPRGSDGPASASRGRGLTALALLVLVLTLVVPLASLVTRARGAYDEALRTAGEEVLTSLAVASGTALVLTLAGAAMAWAFVALGPRARAFGGMLVLATLVVPGAVVGLGLLTLVAGDVFPFGALRGSAALVGWGAAARFLALPVFLLGSFARAWPAALGAAAAVHGARRARILVRIVLPLALPLTLGAAALVFVLALGELPVAVLVAPPGEMTLAVRIESLLHFGKDELVAALCAVQVGLVLAVLGAARLLGEARGKDGRASRAP